MLSKCCHEYGLSRKESNCLITLMILLPQPHFCSKAPFSPQEPFTWPAGLPYSGSSLPPSVCYHSPSHTPTLHSEQKTTNCSSHILVLQAFGLSLCSSFLSPFPWCSEPCQLFYPLPNIWPGSVSSLRVPSPTLRWGTPGNLVTSQEMFAEGVSNAHGLHTMKSGLSPASRQLCLQCPHLRCGRWRLSS